MSITLKEETVLNEWSTLVDQAAEHRHRVLEDIQSRLQEAQIPGECTWALEEVQSSGWRSKVRREFLIVQLQQFKDYRIYIAARDYGVHLDACRFLTVEPGFFKKKVAERLGGDKGALSAPRNILIEQDLKAWVTVVHHTVVDSIHTLVKSLGQDPSLIQRGSKGLLEIW